MEKQKAKYLYEFLKDSLEICLKKQIKVKVLPVKFYYNYVNQD